MLIVQMTGLSGAGKSSLARAVQQQLRDAGFLVEILDGDEYRKNLCPDLGFSTADRQENIRRLGFVAHVLARNRVVALIAAINPYENARQALQQAYPNVRTVWVNCPLEVLRQRDTKGLYRRAALPDSHPDKLSNLTGVNDPFEPPQTPDLVLNTHEETLEQSAKRLLEFVLKSLD
jgi:adenylylsulfate kinase